MDKVKIGITLISKNCKSEEEINEIKSDINKIIEKKYSNPVVNDLFISHINSNTSTPDGKLKIGSIYKLTDNERKRQSDREIIALLVGMFMYKDGSFHLLFNPCTFKDPTMLEANIGLGDTELQSYVDGYNINYNSIGYHYIGNKLYDYVSNNVIETEFIKELDDDEFLKFYLKLYKLGKL